MKEFLIVLLMISLILSGCAAAGGIIILITEQEYNGNIHMISITTWIVLYYIYTKILKRNKHGNIK